MAKESRSRSEIVQNAWNNFRIAVGNKEDANKLIEMFKAYQGPASDPAKFDRAFLTTHRDKIDKLISDLGPLSPPGVTVDTLISCAPKPTTTTSSSRPPRSRRRITTAQPAPDTPASPPTPPTTPLPAPGARPPRRDRRGETTGLEKQITPSGLGWLRKVAENRALPAAELKQNLLQRVFFNDNNLAKLNSENLASMADDSELIKYLGTLNLTREDLKPFLPTESDWDALITLKKALLGDGVNLDFKDRTKNIKKALLHDYLQLLVGKIDHGQFVKYVSGKNFNASPEVPDAAKIFLNAAIANTSTTTSAPTRPPRPPRSGGTPPATHPPRLATDILPPDADLTDLYDSGPDSVASIKAPPKTPTFTVEPPPPPSQEPTRATPEIKFPSDLPLTGESLEIFKDIWRIANSYDNPRSGREDLLTKFFHDQISKKYFEMIPVFKDTLGQSEIAEHRQIYRFLREFIPTPREVAYLDAVKRFSSNPATVEYIFKTLVPYLSLLPRNRDLKSWLESLPAPATPGAQAIFERLIKGKMATDAELTKIPTPEPDYITTSKPKTESIKPIEVKEFFGIEKITAVWQEIYEQTKKGGNFRQMVEEKIASTANLQIEFSFNSKFVAIKNVIIAGKTEPVVVVLVDSQNASENNTVLKILFKNTGGTYPIKPAIIDKYVWTQTEGDYYQLKKDDFEIGILGNDPENPPDEPPDNPPNEAGATVALAREAATSEETESETPPPPPPNNPPNSAAVALKLPTEKATVELRTTTPPSDAPPTPPASSGTVEKKAPAPKPVEPKPEKKSPEQISAGLIATYAEASATAYNAAKHPNTNAELVKQAFINALKSAAGEINLVLNGLAVVSPAVRLNKELPERARDPKGLYRFVFINPALVDRADPIIRKFAEIEGDEPEFVPLQAAIIPDSEYEKFASAGNANINYISEGKIIKAKFNSARPAPYKPGILTRKEPEKPAIIPPPPVEKNITPVKLEQLSRAQLLQIKRELLDYSDVGIVNSDEQLLSYIDKEENSAELLSVLKMLIEKDRATFDKICREAQIQFENSTIAKNPNLDPGCHSISLMRYYVGSVVRTMLQDPAGTKRFLKDGLNAFNTEITDAIDRLVAEIKRRYETKPRAIEPSTPRAPETPARAVESESEKRLTVEAITKIGQEAYRLAKKAYEEGQTQDEAKLIFRRFIEQELSKDINLQVSFIADDNFAAIQNVKIDPTGPDTDNNKVVVVLPNSAILPDGYGLLGLMYNKQGGQYPLHPATVPADTWGEIEGDIYALFPGQFKPGILGPDPNISTPRAPETSPTTPVKSADTDRPNETTAGPTPDDVTKETELSADRLRVRNLINEFLRKKLHSSEFTEELAKNGIKARLFGLAETSKQLDDQAQPFSGYLHKTSDSGYLLIAENNGIKDTYIVDKRYFDGGFDFYLSELLKYNKKGEPFEYVAPAVVTDLGDGHFRVITRGSVKI